MGDQPATAARDNLREAYSEAARYVVKHLGSPSREVPPVTVYSDERVRISHDHHADRITIRLSGIGDNLVYQERIGEPDIFQPGPDITDHLIKLVATVHGGADNA